MGVKKKNEKYMEPIVITDPLLLKECAEVMLDTDSCIQQFIKATKPHTQLCALKQCTQLLKTGLSPPTAEVKLIIKVLVTAFLQANPKNQIRKAVHSCLQSVEGEHDIMIVQAISTQIVQYAGTAQTITDIRHTIDCMTALMDNFTLGERALVSVFSEVLPFISSSVDTFYAGSRDPGGKEEEASYMHHCHVTIQMCNKLLTKVMHSNKAEDRMNSDAHDLVGIGDSMHLMHLCNMMWTILSQVFLLDCRTACGMGVTLILKIIYGTDAMSQLLRLMNISTNLNSDTQTSTPVLSHETSAGAVTIVGNELSISSQLCLLAGLLAMLSQQELMQDIGGACLLTQIIGSHTLRMAQQETDSNTNLVASRTVVLLTNKICECLEGGDISDHIKTTLTGHSTLPQQIIAYAWNHWEDSIDTIRHQTRLVFQNIIQAHLLSSGEDSWSSPFIQQMAASLLGLSWHTKGRYGPLCEVVQHLGTRSLLSLSPRLPEELLMAVGEQALAPYVSELYEKLYRKHRQDLSITLQSNKQDQTSSDQSDKLVQTTSDHSDKLDQTSSDQSDKLVQTGSDLSTWLVTWVDPVLRTLCGGSKTQKTFIIEYMIPTLLKVYPDTFQYIVQQLSGDTFVHDDGGGLGALVTCLKQAKMLGVLPKHQGEPVVWGGIVGRDKIINALCHADDQIRLDAFALLCDNHKTTEVMTSSDLDLIKLFLTFNLESQSPGFRQYMVSLVKKLLVRLRDGGKVLTRAYVSAIKQNGDFTSVQNTLQYYKAFLEWLCDELFQQLHPGASFPRRTTSLSLLSVVTRILGADESKDHHCEEFHFLSTMFPSRVQTLFECFTDTFEQNKTEAFNILSALPIDCLNIIMQDTDKMMALIQSALALASGTRPQDCTTAAYIFRLLLRLPNTGALVMPLTNKQCPVVCSSQQVAWLLLEELQDELEVAKQSLLDAAATRPLYPALHCLRYILADVDLRQEAGCQAWKELIGAVVDACFTVARVVSPVVSHSSPEGNVPTEVLCALGSGLTSDSVITDDQQQPLGASQSVAMVTHMPEYLVVCCWRSIKEVSLVLGQLTQSAPLVGVTEQGQGLLEISQLHAIGEYFITQLLESRHRGAFELAYTGFVKMADMLWRCSLSAVHILPKQWLDEILLAVSETNPSDKLCATRRSAGLPFYVQALVSTEPTTTGRHCFKKVMDTLLHLAWPQDDLPNDAENMQQVHALNILRALYRDTRLGEEVYAYIADGVKVSTLGYASKLWTVRNSSTLLFSALMTRIFGVKRTKNELSKKNCLTGHVFFHRFPSLHSFLLEQLSAATANIGMNDAKQTSSRLHPSLYPVLLLLGRLYPSVIEADNSTFSLKAFTDPVMRCAYISVYKTRVMAARALCPLVAKEDIADTLCQLVDKLPTKECLLPQNAMHGILLQIEALLCAMDELPVSMQTEILSPVSQGLMLRMWILSQENCCYVTRTAYLHALYRTLRLLRNPLLQSVCSSLQPGYVWSKCKDKLLTALSNNLQQHTQVPGAVQFFELTAKYLLELTATIGDDSQKLESVVMVTLTSDLYEVRLQALQFLTNCVGDSGCHSNSADDDDPGHTGTMTRLNMPGQACDLVRNNQDLFWELVTMAYGKETNPDCIFKTLELLYRHPSTEVLPWTNGSFTYTTQQILQKVLDGFMKHSRDEICCASLKLSARIVAYISTNEVQEYMEPMSKKLISDWVAVLEESCDMESSAERKLAAATSLVHTPGLLYLNTDDQTLRLWTIVFRLLQDEDSQVRHQMSLVVQPSQNTSESSHCDLYSTVTLSGALQQLVSAHWGVKCLTQLITWLLQDVEPDWHTEEHAVRLFDKGEMNTYRDQMYFVNIIARQLITMATGGEASQTVAPGDELIQQFVIDQSMSLSLDTACVQYLINKREEILAKLADTADKLSYVDISVPLVEQTEYQEMVHGLCRSCIALSVICRLLAVHEEDIVDISKRIKIACDLLRNKFDFKCRVTEYLDKLS